MASIYDLKPRFQKMLRPVVQNFARRKISANQVTIGAAVLSICYGLLLLGFPSSVLVLVGLPAFLLARMALNAIDGMLAREHNQKSVKGAYLNEIGDIVSDLVIYAPFLIYFSESVYALLLFSGFLIGMVVTEVVGIMAELHGSTRRYEGPMGKSDRAVWMGVFAVFLACTNLASWVLPLFAAALFVLVWATVWNRYMQAELERIKGGTNQ